MTVSFIDPAAECLVEANAYGLHVDLSGAAKIGLVINRIVDCDRFMSEIGAALKLARPDLEIISYDTGTITFADASLMERVASDCDAAVCAIGHCGSCTAGTVKDTIALIEHGIPAVALVTEVFQEQAAALALSLGWPDAPRVQLPYPVWGTEQASMQRVASIAADEVLACLEAESDKTA